MRNEQKHHLTMRATVIAVKRVLAALAIVSSTAYAAESESDEAYALTHHQNTIQVGVGNVSDYSAKYFEYSNIKADGVFAIGKLDFSGGGSYDSDDPFRWSVKADPQNGVIVDGGDQGSYRVKYRYDQINRNYADDYRTPYRGVGTTNLTLPGYPTVRTNTSTSNGSNALANWGNIQSPNKVPCGVPGTCQGGPGYLIPDMMHDANIDTERDANSLEITKILSPNWQVMASGKHETKEGTKLTGVAFGGPARGALLPEPIDSTTDQFKTAVAYSGDQSSLTLGYDGSIYNNHVGDWHVANPFNSNLLDPFFKDSAQLSTAPDNKMNRFSLGGSYNFTPTTRLVANGHYQKMTQDDEWRSTWPSTWDIPVNSADAETIDKNFNTTLTARPMRDLALTAAYKYENRNSKTPVEEFLYRPGDATGNPSLFDNEPLNKKDEKTSLDANYTFASHQAIKVGADYEQIERTADSEESPWAAEDTDETTLRADYRNNVSEYVTGRVGYSFSSRRSSVYEENVLMPTNPPAPLPSADPLLPGFRQYFLADRDRNQIRSSLDYQVTDAFIVQTGLDYNKDEYINSPFGLQYADSWVFKLDGSYDANENLKLNAFYTYESKDAKLESRVIGRGISGSTILDPPTTPGVCDGYYAASGHLPSDEGTDPCRNWSENEIVGINTLGVGFDLAKFMSPKFDLSGEITYSRAIESIEMNGGAYYGNGSNAASPAYNNVWIAAEDFPDITTTYLELHLAGTYELNPVSSVRLDYYYGMLHTKDWQYDAYTNSSLGAVAVPSYIGVGMESPNYSVNVVGASYIYKFE